MKNNTTDVRGKKSASLPPLPRGREIQPGSALVMNVGIKQKMEFVDKDEWFSSQLEMSQSQAFTSSQGQGLVTRRLRTRAKQLEKVKKKEEEEEDEEGVASIWLDDLTSLGLANGPRIDVDVRRRRSRWVGLRGKGSVGRDNLPLATMVEQGMIFGQGSQRLMMDLSRPQPMLEPEVLSKGGEEARAPRSILFEVAARKVDERENLMGAPSTSC
ncbi:hypothetical protein AGABI1DRAFT_112128 [Agaricus bisporus var. burnettii JB137-S8]|uniref:Uncharacterized protein n=1 Tax=Agaricus bisporus var. burnettii (strain JB137-S8 / ATCC MYA-4627 / FGSC 10392) TaxID=597362 RepID=K5X299_AGABU|nr:uncharacterized protein AGABI1DRAFT_112128 [Agaricus bisporus var. burnettii JB137-S8]EKM81941.1 hypothetical protein AGABI1DRAFT_112128 [Agaricus bisporus var. burnettii JB137-S8]